VARVLVSGGGHGLVQPKVLSSWLSNSMETDFCVEALNEAIAKYGKLAIMNSDQGSQFTFHKQDKSHWLLAGPL
jgi:hypothetical protein